jgi:hypothetical protein
VRANWREMSVKFTNCGVREEELRVEGEHRKNQAGSSRRQEKQAGVGGVHEAHMTWHAHGTH